MNGVEFGHRAGATDHPHCSSKQVGCVATHPTCFDDPRNPSRPAAGGGRSRSAGEMGDARAAEASRSRSRVSVDAGAVKQDFGVQSLRHSTKSVVMFVSVRKFAIPAT